MGNLSNSDGRTRLTTRKLAPRLENSAAAALTSVPELNLGGLRLAARGRAVAAPARLVQQRERQKDRSAEWRYIRSKSLTTVYGRIISLSSCERM